MWYRGTGQTTDNLMLKFWWFHQCFRNALRDIFHQASMTLWSKSVDPWRISTGCKKDLLKFCSRCRFARCIEPAQKLSYGIEPPIHNPVKTFWSNGPKFKGIYIETWSNSQKLRRMVCFTTFWWGTANLPSLVMPCFALMLCGISILVRGFVAMRLNATE